VGRLPFRGAQVPRGHETVREYAAKRLAAMPEAPAVHAAHTAGFQDQTVRTNQAGTAVRRSINAT
jgi:predicted ATPase